MNGKTKFLPALFFLVALFFILPGIASADVTGTLEKGGVQVGNVWLNVQSSDTQTVNEYNVWVGADGTFTEALPDGNYVAKQYWDETSQSYVQVAFQFTVTGGVMAPATILVPDSNVTGAVYSQGTPVPDAWIYIEETSAYNYYYAKTDIDGNFEAFLPDGFYRVYGVWTTDYTQLDEQFAVAGGASTPTLLNINVPSKNITGTLNDGAAVNEAWLSIRKADGTNWYGAYVSNGNFNLALPAGDYVVEGYWDYSQSKYVKLYHSFSVTDPSVLTPLNLVVPADNANGTLHLEDGTPVDDVYLSFYSTIENQQLWADAYVTNGSFSLYLPDGDYRVNGYWDSVNEEYVPINADFSIAGGVLQDAPLTLVIPDKNVTGTVDDLDSLADPINAWLSIAKQDYSEWFATQIKDGSFSLTLEDGNYIVGGYWDDTSNNYVRIDKPFSVTGGNQSDALQIQIPAKNVSGVLSTSEGLVADAELSFWFEGQKGEQNGQAFYARVSNGNYSVYLPAGEIRVQGYWDFAKQAYVQLEQTVPISGQPQVVNIAVPDNNVTGTLKYANGDNVPDAWLHFVDQTNPNQWTWKSAQVKDGQFGLYLKPGNYQVDGFWDMAAQEHNQLVQAFTVNGQSVELALRVPDKNVSGTLKYADQSPVARASLHIYNVNDYSSYSAYVEDGAFQLALPDGSYRVSSFYDANAQKSTELKVDFVVSGGVANPNPLNIIIPEENVVGILTKANGTLIPNVHLSISQDEDGKYEYYFTQVDGEGEFSLALPDGSYKITGFWDSNTGVYKNLAIKFTVVNGVTDPKPLVVIVPDNNVEGTVANKDQIPLSSGWVNINRMVDNGPWEGFSAKVTNGAFSLYLPDGKYLVNGIFDESEGKFINYEKEFTVSGGKPSELPLRIVYGLNNFKGTVTNEAGEPINGISLMVFRKTSETSYMGNYVQVVNGKFESQLSDGEYKIPWYMEINTSTGVTLQKPLFITFTVSNGMVDPLNIVLKADNVSGKVTKESGETAQGVMTIIKDGGEAFSDFTVSVQNGVFSAYIPDGKYIVVSYTDGATGDYSQVYAEFTVSNGVVSSGPIDVFVKTPNVSGTVSIQGSPLENGWVEISNADGSGYYGTKVTKGAFRLFLEDGEYKVSGLFNYSSTNIGRIELSTPYTFTVQNGVSTPNPLQVQIN